MGNSGSSYLGRYQKDQWTPVGQEHDYSLDLKHRSTGQLCTLARLETLNEADRNAKLQQFTKRLPESCNVLRLVDIVRSGGCQCGGKESLGLLLETISSRLCDYDQVVTQEIFIILEQSLFGFQQLKNSTDQCFMVDDRMIMLNSDLEVRVWLHHNTLRNEPQQLCGGMQPQEEMVNSIFRAVEQHSTGKSFPVQFQEMRRMIGRPLVFRNALTLVKEFQEQYQVGGEPGKVPVRNEIRPYQTPFKTLAPF